MKKTCIIILLSIMAVSLWGSDCRASLLFNDLKFQTSQEYLAFPSLLTKDKGEMTLDLSTKSDSLFKTDWTTTILVPVKDFCIGSVIKDYDQSSYRFSFDNTSNFNKINRILISKNRFGFGLGFYTDQLKYQLANGHDLLKIHKLNPILSFSSKNIDLSVAYKNQYFDYVLTETYLGGDGRRVDHIVDNDFWDFQIKGRSDHYLKNLVFLMKYQIAHYDETKIMSENQSYQDSESDRQSFEFSFGQEKSINHLKLNYSVCPISYIQYDTKKKNTSIYSDYDEKFNSDHFKYHLRMTAEYRFTKWFKGLFSTAYYNYYSSDNNKKTQLYSYNYNFADFHGDYLDTSFGMTFLFKDFEINTLLKKDVIMDGPYLISGDKTGLNSQISLTYRF